MGIRVTSGLLGPSAAIFILSACSLLQANGETSVSAPSVVRPPALSFASPPSISGLSAAWGIGSEKGQGLYLLRVKLKEGSRLPPHTHPDARVTTVLSGAVAVGFGDTLDESKIVTVHSGESYLVPAGQPHFIIARGGDAEYQEVGSGATGTEMIRR